MIRGTTTLIAHLGYPTTTFKAPLIYNPYFEHAGIDAAVVPMGVKAEDYPQLLRPLFRLANMHGALVTMPHKVVTVALLDEVSPAVEIAGACNAIVRRADGTLSGELFDGVGFVRAVQRRGVRLAGCRALVVGSGGVGSAIAAALAAAAVGELGLFDVNAAAAAALAGRLRQHYPEPVVAPRDTADPAGYDLVVNATPLGMRDDDPLPFDVSRLDSRTLVGEVVLKQEMTPVLKAAQHKGCAVLVGTDMLFEQIPAYLEFFGFASTTAERLRALAQIEY